MPVFLADVFGSPNIGVYCYCDEKVVIVPPGLTHKKLNQISEALDVEICQTTIGGSTLVGALVTGNSRAVLVPHIIRDYEIERIRKLTVTTIVKSNWTALGNVILVNDNGAVIHPETPREIIGSVEKELGVESVQAKIGGLPFVGALGIATNKGAILSPHSLREEKLVVESALKIDAELGTTNGGVGFVKSGIIANSKGAVIGPLTRGAELMQITRALSV